MGKEETDEAAERKKRLQALRNKQKEQPVKSVPGSKAGSGDDDSSNRKREFIKNIMKKRMQEGGAGGEGKGKNAKKGLLKRAMKKSAGAGGASGEEAGQYPRLKALMEKRGGKGGASSVDVEELEARVTRLEQALEKALEMFEKEAK